MELSLRFTNKLYLPKICFFNQSQGLFGIVVAYQKHLLFLLLDVTIS
jgi:hypothetical protein